MIMEKRWCAFFEPAQSESVEELVVVPVEGLSEGVTQGVTRSFTHCLKTRGLSLRVSCIGLVLFTLLGIQAPFIQANANVKPSAPISSPLSSPLPDSTFLALPAFDVELNDPTKKTTV